jgi:chromobox protein 1
VLDEYLARIGGREKIFDQTHKALNTKKRGRSIGGTPNGAAKRSRKNGTTHPAESTPPATVKKWSPPAGSWEDEIDTIDACEDGGGGKLVVYLIWKNGQKTKHDTQVIYKKCPQKVRQYRWITTSHGANWPGDADVAVLRASRQDHQRRE